MKKQADDFTLANFCADQPRSVLVRVSMPKPLLQYVEGYARYRYDLTGQPTSPQKICAEATHMFYKNLLRIIPEKQAYKVPDYQMRRRATAPDEVMEDIRFHLARTTLDHIRQAIEFGYIYANFSKPSFSAVVREAVQQHYYDHSGQLILYTARNPWLIVKC